MWSESRSTEWCDMLEGIYMFVYNTEKHMGYIGIQSMPNLIARVPNLGHIIMNGLQIT